MGTRKTKANHTWYKLQFHANNLSSQLHSSVGRIYFHSICKNVNAVAAVVPDFVVVRGQPSFIKAKSGDCRYTTVRRESTAGAKTAIYKMNFLSSYLFTLLCKFLCVLVTLLKYFLTKLTYRPLHNCSLNFQHSIALENHLI